VEVELFHANSRTDRQTDKTKVIITYRNFVKAPKTYLILVFLLPFRL